MKRAGLLLGVGIGIGAVVLSIGYFAFVSGNDKGITLYGNVDVREVDIGFRVAGLVDRMLFQEGDRVKKGALMCTLQKIPYDSQLDEAVASAHAVQVSADNAETLYRRRNELIGIGAVSEEDLDNAKARRDELKAELIRAAAAVAVAKDNLLFTEAYAPIDGVILTRIREPGTVVNPGEPVYTLSISSPVWIRAYVDEPLLGKIHYGMEATVHTDSGGKYRGTIGFISPVAEFTPKTVESPTLRTDLVYRIRVYVDQPNEGLLQGMPVTITFANGS